MRDCARIFGFTAVATLLVMVSSIVGQQNRPSVFESASIKPDKWEPGLVMGGGCRGTDTKIGSGALPVAPLPLGRCRMTRMTLRMLVEAAYLKNGMFNIDADQLVQGGPKWVDSDRFTVEAKACPFGRRA